MTSNELMNWTYGEHKVRTVMREGEPWFVLADVCGVLDLKRVDSTARMVPDRHKDAHPLSTLGGTQNMTIVDEPGLYRVIVRSDKPETKAFRRWVA